MAGREPIDSRSLERFIGWVLLLVLGSEVGDLHHVVLASLLDLLLKGFDRSS